MDELERNSSLSSDTESDDNVLLFPHATIESVNGNHNRNRLVVVSSIGNTNVKFKMEFDTFSVDGASDQTNSDSYSGTDSELLSDSDMSIRNDGKRPSLWGIVSKYESEDDSSLESDDRPIRVFGPEIPAVAEPYTPFYNLRKRGKIAKVEYPRKKDPNANVNVEKMWSSYMCKVCGKTFTHLMHIKDHMSAQHEGVEEDFYKMEGEHLVKSDAIKHLYLPMNALRRFTAPQRLSEIETDCINEGSLKSLKL